MKRSLLILATLAAGAGPLAAQAVPEGAQAMRVPAGYRRSPQFRVDPFRHVFIPRWGFVLSLGGTAENNTLNFSDIGALLFLSDSLNNPDGILLGDVLDAMALVPRGAGAGGMGQGEGGLYLGGPMGHNFSVGVSVQTRGYGTFHLDDGAVALLRDGNIAIQEFALGDTKGSVLATSEIGGHAVFRWPLGTEDGGELVLGFGARFVKPYYYARGRSLIDSRVVVTDTTVVAAVQVEKAVTPATGLNGLELLTSPTGTGITADLLARVEWPMSGLAFEVLVANLGRVTVDNVDVETLSFNVQTTNLKEVSDSLSAATFAPQAPQSVSFTLPRIVRFGASAWANRILQLDAAVTLPTGGEFASPTIVDLGSTWRVLSSVPLRAGVVLGGHQRIGYTGGIAFETQNLYLQLAGGSLGGMFGDAKGASGRLDLGFFF